MDLLYSFYGDDFTGSTDVLEQLASNGIPTVLFVAAPTSEQLAAFPDARAIGIAGDSRSRSPQWMSENLPAIFTALQSLHAPILHYKVCSTFDSSPAHGNIGRAIEIGLQTLRPSFVPVVVGAPHLRRYVVLGNLFAAAPDGRVLRIDRHPMAHHPVTPMREADLRVHLSAQTALSIGLVDHTAVSNGTAATLLQHQLATGHQPVLFDTVDTTSLAAIGDLLWGRAQQQPLFSASSSGLTVAILGAMRSAGLLPPPAPASLVSIATPLLVVSGSCSQVTERQIRYALAHGYRGIAVNPAALLRSPADTLASVVASLQAGHDTVVYTTLGLPDTQGHGDALGRSLGTLLSHILERRSARRVLLCGGDTASHAVQQMGLQALTWLANLQPGAPLCRAHAPGNPVLHNLELVLKGGQVGTDNFFDVVRGAAR